LLSSDPNLQFSGYTEYAEIPAAASAPAGTTQTGSSTLAGHGAGTSGYSNARTSGYSNDGTSGHSNAGTSGYANIGYAK